MRILRRHVVAELLQYLRTPSFYLPLFAYPVLLYLLVGLPGGGSGDHRLAVLVGFVLFSVLGTVTFQFGVGVAVTRQSAWERWLFSVPVRASTRLAARLAVACIFSALFVVPVIVVGTVVGRVEVDPRTVPGILAAILAGAVPMGLMGLAMGYWFPVRGALGLANLVYLPLSFLGGLFSGGSTGGEPWSAISVYLPTGAWTALTNASIGIATHPVPLAVVVLLGHAGLFGTLAATGYRRSQAILFR
ncbi:ABC transporter permease [Planctomonas psychrotolerans]|uniref:ABC transporter permease n=1 Tax=Planctomonas psychrotolerans TaxID=2528712 RepID=UPI001238522C|nr:ABC transporter permease [Planctomonas psychrotolerans]